MSSGRANLRIGSWRGLRANKLWCFDETRIVTVLNHFEDMHYYTERPGVHGLYMSDNLYTT